MLTTAALILIVTCHIAVGQDMPEKGPYSLDMALQSVDDQYYNCTEDMRHKVQTCYLKKEITANKSGFANAWRDAENSLVPQDNLTINHLIAIRVYSSKKVYSEFNNAIRNGKQSYRQLVFGWYSLHFWLTEALQILKKSQQECRLTYRGTHVNFTQSDVLNKEIRFGSFASSSLDKNEAKNFGNLSCFEIYTCHGADVTKYSEHGREKEVLIPPYEKFIITAIRKGQKGDWCKTVYKLNSSGIQSNLSCAVANRSCPSLSRKYIRGGQITSPRAFLSDPRNSYFMRSKHGNEKGSGVQKLSVQQRKDSKIFHQYRPKGGIYDFIKK
ncbi:Ecto-ADP-ribosyltransferase 5 [Triplophysa tibetana]|uniref:NAD(P)(+)--arginine ADP-ribosyltransferase n=1 Tax=Triplophysa tibetana TaxID=1572043 RepID=A0A5A9NAJ5_9TELE|nr:Ecto-ADP-ribosyltransferase 5 [Triplophysa tibetana]KAA0706091.1 Ecto-ADP-ribosyltransferase 5 [Triplophysa tibetana]